MKRRGLYRHAQIHGWKTGLKLNTVLNVASQSRSVSEVTKKTESKIESIDFPDEYKVLGADLSLKRPSFCLLSIENEDGIAKITDIKFKTVDNKTKVKPHGMLLDEIFDGFAEIWPYGFTIFAVRETEIMKMKVPSERSLSKVVGLMDWTLWRHAKSEWYSIYPMTIKKLIAGNGKAEKSEVATALEKYIGKQDYKCDDESDAAAVAIAWLIQHGQIKEI